MIKDSYTTVTMKGINNDSSTGYTYGYDQLNRLLEMRQHTISGDWSNSNVLDAYREPLAYDANGNILKYLRHGTNQPGRPLEMDSLNYKYNRDVHGRLVKQCRANSNRRRGDSKIKTLTTTYQLYMEYKSIIGWRLVAIIILLQSCGYFDHDKVEYQNEIVKNIIIQKREGDSLTNLIFKETNDVSAVIIDDCLKVYYDSTDKTLYVETYQTKVDRNYWQIDILNPLAKYVSEATKKEEINQKFFNEKTRTFTRKWEFQR